MSEAKRSWQDMLRECIKKANAETLAKRVTDFKEKFSKGDKFLYISIVPDRSGVGPGGINNFEDEES